MFGLVGKYIGNKETKGCHKCWLKLCLKDRGGEALSYGGFSDCVIVAVTELLVHAVEWPPASGKHFSTCEESLIPGAELGSAICVCGTAAWLQQATAAQGSNTNTNLPGLRWARPSAARTHASWVFLLCKEMAEGHFWYHQTLKPVAGRCTVSCLISFLDFRDVVPAWTSMDQFNVTFFLNDNFRGKVLLLIHKLQISIII